MGNKLEQRLMDVRARDLGEDNQMIVEGYAVVFNTETRLFEDTYEQIDRGAFDGVDFSDVRAFYDHKTGNLLGRTKADTLRLTIDDTGLRFRLILPNTQLGRDTYELVKRGDLSQCSFGFYVGGEDWIVDGETYHRTITKIDELVEISLVSIPAYDDTTVTVAQRSVEAIKERKRKLELEYEFLSLAVKS